MNAVTDSAGAIPMHPRPEILGLEGDDDGRRIVEEELRLLTVVKAALEDAARAALGAIQGKAMDDARLLELRDDVAAAKPEDLPSLFEQMHHIGALRAQRGKGSIGALDRACPYFGHLRLEESGKRRDVLIGASSYVDTAAGVRIVDWRHAPVSRIFYRYHEEDDYEEKLGDRLVEGLVLARRSVSIVGGELMRVAAPQGTFVRTPEGWKRVATRHAQLRTPQARPPLGNVGREQAGVGRDSNRAARLGVGIDGELRQDKHLPAIASMLDQAQFELITRPGAGLIAIQGSAGSGKTTVGLHRVAYLAFSDPNRFRPEKMLVVVPHEALRHYVGRVLPSLGVEGVTISTFERICKRLLPVLFPRLPTSVNDETPPVVVRAKTDPKILQAIDDAGRRMVEALGARISRAMEKWPSGDAVLAAWTETDRRGATPEMRVTQFAGWVSGSGAIGRNSPSKDLPASTRSAVEALLPELRRTSKDVLGVWDEILTSRERLSTTFSGDLAPPQLDRLHDWCVRQARTRADKERDGEVGSIDYEDGPILLRLWQVLRGPLTGPDGTQLRFSHLFIDEVQDASPVELRVLVDLATKDQSITLAGDIAQRMLDEGDERGEFDWKKLLGQLQLEAELVEPLKVSYRSTAEITDFARGVLGHLAHGEEPIPTRNGPAVELLTFGSMGESVAFVADALKELASAEPEANVALISRFAPQADVFFDGLVRAEVPRVRRVREQDFTWEAGFDVTDVRQVKGLEFDEVVLLETTASAYPDTAQARHALYVAATRASHQLWCISSDKPSPVVIGAMKSPTE